jgi:hypothetical protein
VQYAQVSTDRLSHIGRLAALTFVGRRKILGRERGTSTI